MAMSKTGTPVKVEVVEDWSPDEEEIEEAPDIEVLESDEIIDSPPPKKELDLKPAKKPGLLAQVKKKASKVDVSFLLKKEEPESQEEDLS